MSKEADGALDADPSPDPAEPTNEETGSGGFSHCPSTQLVSGRGRARAQACHAPSSLLPQASQDPSPASDWGKENSRSECVTNGVSRWPLMLFYL